MATNGHIHHDDHRPSAEPTTESGAAASSGNSNLPKDEVGWYFVEQYYTTLSKSPDKLHLFYGKRSQFVYGQEAELSPVSVGRPAIQERIKNLDFSDCKVRISNVDSQGSGENIVIQVIGETSNKAGEPRKFVQTFVLAQQPSGYFVLNDILRYVNEDDDEAVEAESEPAAPVEVAAAPVVEAEAETEPEPETAQEAPVAVEAAEAEEPAELDADVVDKKLEEAVATEEAVSEPAEAVVEPVAEVQKAEAEEKAAPEPVADVEKAVEEIAEEEVKKPESPKAPTPTPAVQRAAAPAPAEPAKPKEAPKPMTWASRAAAAAGPTRPVAVVPIPKTATPPAQTRAPAPTATAAAATLGPAAAAAQPAATQASDSSPATSVKDQGEWQTAEVKRQNRPQSLSATPLEKEGTMAYIKYVTDKVKDEDLKGLLATFGELAYFDINRQKNCAFVEFKTTSGYNAAIAANPHTVNGESILVEQRRPKANAYGGSNYNSTRGGTPGRGRGGFEAGRGGSQGTGRGGFPGQTRGRGGAPRARGPSSQAGAA
ncbi:NTF2 and RRM domain-containing protein [Cercophora scortea]|uniref:NTF2 and RRM domain-containing protein n=1 Tax=Cercophora scortea TaxID=314031 RepID=A0AAE0MI59_9PEZI|nr:NTF2 and RRM domain-containing protein [Cercophora scortea]